MKLRALLLFSVLVLFLPAVASAQAPTCFMSATPWSITKGGSFTLKWSSTNATNAIIPGPGLGAVEPNGQRNLIPIRSTRYTGTFTGSSGKATCQTVVTVVLPDGGGSTVLLDADDPLYFDEPDEVDEPGGVNSPGGINAPKGVNAPAPLQNVPALAPAPTIQPGSAVQLSNKEGKGLVPCTGIDCQACHLASLAQNIINFLIGLSIPLAAALFAYAGVIYFTSGVINKIEKAKKIFNSVLIGFALVAGGWLIVNTILHTILDKSQYPDGSWFKIKCVPVGERKTNESITTLFNSISILNNLNTAPGGTGPGGGGESDATNREILRNAGIGVNAGYPQTSLAGMRSETINEIMSICSHVSTGECVVTGGTETTGGHSCGGEYSHCNGYKFDLRSTPGVDSYISGLCGGNNQCTIGNRTYTREGDHWDVLVR